MDFDWQGWLMFCPLSWIYYFTSWVFSKLWLPFYSCFEWISKIFRRRAVEQRQNILPDIRSRGNFNIDEYDVLGNEHSARSDLESTVGYGSSSSPRPSSFRSSTNRSDPICIPGKTKPIKRFSDCFRTTSTRPTLELVDERRHPRRQSSLKKPKPKEDSTPLTTSDDSLIFPMSPVQ